MTTIRTAMTTVAAVAVAGMVAADNDADVADGGPPGDPAFPPGLRLNQIQVIGSHNSYHIAPPPGVLGLIRTVHADGAEAWDYTHPTLTEQLDRHGLRQFELDVFADPDGGLFADPLGHRVARRFDASLPEFNAGGEWSQPGFKVLHVPDIDCWSHTPTLRGAFEELLKWSRRNPGHVPLMVLLECKDQRHPPLPTRPLPFTRDRLLELEREILEVVPAGLILTPDEVRGDFPSLGDAVRQRGWPLVDDLRGRFLLALDNTGAIRDRYLEDNPSLQGRLMFASAPSVDHPAAGWFKRNDPVRGFGDIRRLVDAGFLVRTRADDPRAPDPARARRAFESGAQWISTDHFTATAGADGRVRFDEHPAQRKNPRTTGGR